MLEKAIRGGIDHKAGISTRRKYVEPRKVERTYTTIRSSTFFRGNNRPFSYSEKESQSNDTLLHFVEFSNVHNSDRNSNATRSNLVYKTV